MLELLILRQNWVIWIIVMHLKWKLRLWLRMLPKLSLVFIYRSAFGNFNYFFNLMLKLLRKCIFELLFVLSFWGREIILDLFFEYQWELRTLFINIKLFFWLPWLNVLLLFFLCKDCFRRFILNIKDKTQNDKNITSSLLVVK